MRAEAVQVPGHALRFNEMVCLLLESVFVEVKADDHGFLYAIQKDGFFNAEPNRLCGSELIQGFQRSKTRLIFQGNHTSLFALKCLPHPVPGRVERRVRETPVYRPHQTAASSAVPSQH